MLQWIKSHKNIIIAGGIILIVLIAAFLLGGPIHSASEPKENGAASTQSGQEPSSKTDPSEVSTEASSREEAKRNSTQTEQPSSEEAMDTHENEQHSSEGTADSEARGTEAVSASEVTEASATEADQAVTFSCTISITCESILEHMDSMEPAKVELVPESGIILSTTTVTVTEGESAYDVLRKACTNAGIPLDASITPGYGSAYVRGIQNIYEFDCGSLSGWKYRVNGTVPNYGCSAYILQEGDSIQFYYATDLNN